MLRVSIGEILEARQPAMRAHLAAMFRSCARGAT